MGPNFSLTLRISCYSSIKMLNFVFFYLRMFGIFERLKLLHLRTTVESFRTCQKLDIQATCFLTSCMDFKYFKSGSTSTFFFDWRIDSFSTAPQILRVRLAEAFTRSLWTRKHGFNGMQVNSFYFINPFQIRVTKWIWLFRLFFRKI